MCDGLAGGGVLQSDCASLQRASLSAHDDGVTGRDGEARESVGVVGIPCGYDQPNASFVFKKSSLVKVLRVLTLVPSIKAHSTTAGVEVDTGLENGGGASVSLCQVSIDYSFYVLVGL